MKNQIVLLVLLFSILLFTNMKCTNSTQDSVRPEEANSSGKTVILAIDGGGIKGIIPAVFLDSIESRMGKPSYQLFDLIGGTSTGGIISVALTSPNIPNAKNLPYTASEIVDIYRNNGSSIFVPQNEDFHATYFADNGNGGGVEPYLQGLLGASTKLSDNFNFMQGLLNARVKQMFTTSYIVNSSGDSIPSPVRGTDYGPYLFNWQDAKISFNDDYFVWEAARATSAAPTYFPIAQVGGNQSPRSVAPEKWVIDGGTMSNNPAVWGVSEAIRTGLATDLEDIVVISLGTGYYPGAAGVDITDNVGFTSPANGNWSEVPWVVDPMYDLEGFENGGGTLLDVILDAVQMVSNSQLTALQKSGLQYYRLEPILTQQQSPMDSIGLQHVDSLAATAAAYLANEGAATFANIINALESE